MTDNRPRPRERESQNRTWHMWQNVRTKDTDVSLAWSDQRRREESVSVVWTNKRHLLRRRRGGRSSHNCQNRDWVGRWTIDIYRGKVIKRSNERDLARERGRERESPEQSQQFWRQAGGDAGLETVSNETYPEQRAVQKKPHATWFSASIKTRVNYLNQRNVHTTLPCHRHTGTHTEGKREVMEERG